MTIKRIFSLAVICMAFCSQVAAEEMPALRVTCASPGGAIAAWQAGDKLQVYHNGVVYPYVTEQSGNEAVFCPVVQADAYDSTKPINVYFNVDAVNGKGEAVFSVKAEQRPGDLSGRLPQWGRAEGTSVQMQPLATVIELSASTAEQFRVSRVVLLPLNSASGFTSVTGARMNPQTGKLTLPEAKARPKTLAVSLEDVDLSAHPVISVMVAGVNPGSQGLVVNCFRGRNNNMRAVILQGKEAGVSGPACISIDLGAKKTGIATLSDFEDFLQGLNRGDRTALKYCNEDGVVCLHTDLDLSSIAGPGKDWAGIKNLCANFDGKGHTIYGYKLSRPGSAAIFASTSGSVRNVNFGRRGDFLEVTGGNFSLAAPIAMATNPNAVVEGCVNRSEVRSRDACTGGVIIGGIVARSSSSVRNCANLGKVTLQSASSHGVKYVGGIVGNVIGDQGTNANDISSCVNRGEISCNTSEKAWVGGVAGRISENAKAWTVEKCTNKGKVFIAGTEERISILSSIGGIVGELALPASCHGASHLVKGCRNTGAVFTNADGRISMGGIAGLVRMTRLENCSNAAEVSHGRGLDSEASLERNYMNMGGIVGLLSMGSEAFSCENATTGAVSSTYSCAHRMGGIAGNSSKSVISQCSNAAPLTFELSKVAKSVCAAGGICGVQDGAATDCIDNSTNSGNVSLTVNVTGLNAVAGGVLGFLSKGGISNCRNSGNVTAVNQLALPDMHCLAGGIAARVNSKDVTGVEGCANNGQVSASAPFSPSKGIVVSGEIVARYD